MLWNIRTMKLSITSMKIPPMSIEGPTLFFGNSINEMGLEKTLKVIRENNPDIIAYIEPELKTL